jgi:hypothetical protein
VAIKPRQFPMHLKRKLARWCYDQGKRRARALEPLGIAEKILRDRQTVSNRLAGAGLRGHEKITAIGGIRQNGGLDLRQPVKIALRQSSGERRMCGH